MQEAQAWDHRRAQQDRLQPPMLHGGAVYAAMGSAAYIDFVLWNLAASVPKVVEPLADSYNEHVHYGAAVAQVGDGQCYVVGARLR